MDRDETAKEGRQRNGRQMTGVAGALFHPHIHTPLLRRTRVVPAMLSALVKEHQVRQQAKKEEIEKKKQDALASANNLTSALVDHLNEG